MDQSEEFVVQHVSELPLPGKTDFGTWIRAVLNEVEDAGSAQVTIRLVDDKESAELNQRYRGQPAQTNVLAFPSQVPPGLPAMETELGDLVVCLPKVLEEAAAQGKSPSNHLAHLVVHGTLHLLGYTHDQSDDARRMEATEIRILAELGIANPYVPEMDGAETRS